MADLLEPGTGADTGSVPTTAITLDHRGRLLRGWEYGGVRPGAPAVLLVHGFGDTDTGARQLFVQTARVLAERGVGVRSYSRLGHGVSDGDFARITIGDEVAQVTAMVQQLAADAGAPVHVVAHSLGAVESAMAAAGVPDLVRSLTLWSPAGVVIDDITVHDAIMGQPIAPVRQRGWFDFGGTALGPAFIDEVQAGLDPYGVAVGYRGPAMVVHGTADTIVPVEYGQRYGELLPGATFVSVQGADHGWSSVPLRQDLLRRLLAFTGL
ncbi:alpha/beta hydrolase [Curtobacterium sp. VKM Ac-2922]|uniref:alpha/beta hydrolase n=1 Tax=Curtobacterium sp. VKM Ac-2922 TaxID=2929475 RepID=UPI001FB1A9C8|nr:alpha/beta fold hydrolase [Curtobacterium sp. VKM Ac-2922]MCJ1715811.1 alpha/beta hydrolase [Curtobacterium sp. VKM Ac-2922]